MFSFDKIKKFFHLLSGGRTQLNDKWWHRLLKVIFTVLSIIILIISFVIFYSQEHGSTSKYELIKDFKTFIEESKTDNSSDWKLDGGKMLVVESFLSAYSLKGELGCIITNGSVTILPEYDFRSIDCDLDRTVVCNIPQDVCGGDASRIIKYKGDVQYTITNYFNILTKVFLVLIAWGTTCYIFYYKMFLYVIFGKEPLKYSKK